MMIGDEFRPQFVPKCPSDFLQILKAKTRLRLMQRRVYSFLFVEPLHIRNHLSGIKP